MKRAEMTAEPEVGPASVRAVARALRILSSLDRNGMNLTEIAAKTNLAVPTVLRMVRTLEAEGFVERSDESGRVRLGPAIIRLAYLQMPGGGPRWVAKRAVTELRDRIDETASFSVQDGLDRVFVEMAESQNALRWSAVIGARTPLHLGATGRVLLAFGADKTTLQRLADSGRDLGPTSEGDPMTIDRLESELKNIRSRGYDLSFHETTPDCWGAACPIFGEGGLLLGVLSFAAPMARYNRALEPRLVEAALAAAETAVAVGM
jgi:DNA-binding IclR family transcriptional regulator